MKNLTTGIQIVLIMIGFFSAMIAQEWVQQNSNTFESLSGIYMLSEADGWVCGDGGTLLHTVDGGANWSPVILTNEDLHSVAFRDGLTGLVAGDNGLIFRTATDALRKISLR